MATLEKRAVGRYRLVFWYRSQRYQGAIKADDQKGAMQVKARVERNLELLDEGRLDYQPGDDLFRLLLSDGKLNKRPEIAERITLKDFFDRYKQNRPLGKEQNTARTENIHIGHLLRIMGGDTVTIDVPRKLQEYVNARSAEDGRRGDCVSAVTVRKEISTLTAIWTKWGIGRGLVSVPLGIRHLQYGKGSVKPPFQTFEQIERKVSQGASDALWDSVYLSVAQIESLLEHVRAGISLVKGHARHFDFVYPMFVFAAQTGARRSELMRSRREDFDFERGEVTIREKKKDRTKHETYRHVPLTPLLKEAIRVWFEVHPGGPLTFCRMAGEPISEQMANHHFRWALEGSKWKVLRGWHVFRHSFISNMASRGVDQRVIMELVGHLNPETTRRYQHLFPSTVREAVRLVFGNG